MRISFTSDIHSDVTPQNGRMLPYLAGAVGDLAPDVFVIAGDTANSLEGLHHALAAFEPVEATKLFVPSNHDVWTESKSAVRRRQQDSWHKYTVAVPEVCRAHGFHCLNGSAHP